MSENIDNTLSAYLGPEFQQRLMWQLLVEPEFAEKTIPNLAIEYFDDPNLKRLFIIILEYFKEFEKVPNLQNQSIFQAINKYKNPNNTIEEESLFAVIKRIEMWNERIINKQLLYDGDIVQRQTTDFIKQQEYRKIAEGIIVKVKNGEIKSKYTIAKIEDDFQKVAHIGDDEDYGINVFDNIDHALRKEFRQPIATGVHVIDALTGGGLGKGEIGVILTPSGVGKTTLLTKIANTAFDEGKNVAQIIFEDTKEQIQRKHFAIWANSALSKMDEEEENSRVNKVAHDKCEKMIGKGCLMVKRFSQENTTIVDIRKWMIGYQKKFGIKFDILVLDYLDCLEPHKKSPDRNEAELVIIKGFETLAADFDIPAWTAIQTNRSGFNAEYVEAYQTGGSIKRVQKAHFFMSVAKTKDQQEASLANIRIIKARFAKDGQAFDDCIFNNDTLQIIIEDKRYPLQVKGIKHSDTEDINLLDKNVTEIQKKSSDINIHSALSKREESLISRINDPALINTILDKEAPIDTEQFFKKNDNTDNEYTETTKTEELFEIDGNIETKIENKNVTENTTEELNNAMSQPSGRVYYMNPAIGMPKKDDLLDWSGETFTVNKTEIEVKLEDLPLKETNIKENNIIEEVKSSPPKQENIIPKVTLSPEEIKKIEDGFPDPDTPPIVHLGIYEKILLAEKHQNIIIKK